MRTGHFGGPSSFMPRVLCLDGLEDVVRSSHQIRKRRIVLDARRP
jgi:hypothetical protein